MGTSDQQIPDTYSNFAVTGGRSAFNAGLAPLLLQSFESGIRIRHLVSCRKLWVSTMIKSDSGKSLLLTIGYDFTQLNHAVIAKSMSHY